MKRSCMAIVALLALSVRGPVQEHALFHGGDVHDRRDIGLEMRHAPGATSTADYVLRRGAIPAGQPHNITTVRSGEGRYVF